MDNKIADDIAFQYTSIPTDFLLRLKLIRHITKYGLNEIITQEESMCLIQQLLNGISIDHIYGYLDKTVFDFRKTIGILG